METLKIFNTVDLDTNDKETVAMVTEKIRRKFCCEKLESRPSARKGWHFFITCNTEKYCDSCRLVFDDARRFAMDSMRPIRLRNVLFEGVGDFHPASEMPNFLVGTKIQWKNRYGVWIPGMVLKNDLPKNKMLVVCPSKGCKGHKLCRATIGLKIFRVDSDGRGRNLGKW